MAELNGTHDPGLKSFVAAANDGDCDFPIQNLALGITSDGGGIAIGDALEPPH